MSDITLFLLTAVDKHGSDDPKKWTGCPPCIKFETLLMESLVAQAVGKVDDIVHYNQPGLGARLPTNLFPELAKLPGHWFPMIGAANTSDLANHARTRQPVRFALYNGVQKNGTWEMSAVPLTVDKMLSWLQSVSSTLGGSGRPAQQFLTYRPEPAAGTPHEPPSRPSVKARSVGGSCGGAYDIVSLR